MARVASLWPDDNSKKDKDITKADLEGYTRTAGRHFQQLNRLNNSRQVLFSSNIGVITFEKRIKEVHGSSVPVTYAIQDLYTTKRDPEDLIARPKPESFTRHEVPLRDLGEDRPKIKPS